MTPVDRCSCGGIDAVPHATDHAPDCAIWGASHDPHEYADKIFNLPETPKMFHRQAPGLPMATRCGIVMGREARQTSHSLLVCNPCPVCFAGWGWDEKVAEMEEKLDALEADLG